MTEVKQFDGLPFFINSGTRVSEEKFPEIQAAIERLMIHSCCCNQCSLLIL